MKPNCAATCNHCGAASCANVETDASCEAAKTGGYCTNTQWASWMATNCKKSCGCNSALPRLVSHLFPDMTEIFPLSRHGCSPGRLRR